MQIWLPYIKGGSGTDVWTHRFAAALNTAGHDPIVQSFPHRLQYTPWRLARAVPPFGCAAVVANSWNAFAFRRGGTPLVAVEHLFVLDPLYRPYKSFAQSLFHETLIRRFIRASYAAADAVVGASIYAADQVRSFEPRCQRIEGSIASSTLSGGAMSRIS